MVAQVLEDILGWNLAHLELLVKHGDLVDLVLVRFWIDEALIDGDLYERRLDVASCAPRYTHIQEFL